MHPILLYLLKMLLCSGIMYGYYRMALYNERFHQWNRFYLLAAMLLSVLVPLIEIPLMAEKQTPGMVFLIETMPATIVAKAAPLFSTETLVYLATGGISLVLLVKLAWGLYQTVYRPYQSGEVSMRDDISVIVTETPSAPYSFFRWLFWRHDLAPDSPHGRRVLDHELTHIREKHSADKLFTELLLVIFWCNPFFWMIRKELYVIHEFLADRKAISDNNGAAFAQMILQTLHVHTPSPLTNPFFSSQIKRRLKMITTSNKPQFSYLRRISALVAMIGVSITLMLTIEQGMAQKAPPPPPPAPIAPAPPSPPEKISLPDSIKLIEVIQRDGKNMVTITLKNGKVRKMTMEEAAKKGYPVPPPPPPPAPPAPPAPPSPKNIQPDEIESIVVDTQNHRAWVKLKNMTFLDLSLMDAQCLIDANPQKVTRKTNLLALSNEDPLFVYAGLIISKTQMEQIDPATIESIDVLKGEKALAAYGEKGKNGVVLITPKFQDFSNFSNVRPDPKEIVVTGYPNKNYNPGPALPKAPKVAIGYPIDPTTENTPIMVLNGKILSQNEMSAINPNSIDKINILKGQKAIEAYGEKGANGVVEIELKQNTNPTGDTKNVQGSVYGKVFTQADKMPEFPGGEEGWTRYLQKNLRYPQQAIDQGIQGVVKVAFIVDHTGNLSDFEIVQNPGSGLGEEALRIIKEGPNWEPAEQNKYKVNARVTQTITFRLE